MNIELLKPEGTSDFRTLIGIYKEVFENSTTIPNNQHLEKLLSNPGFMVFVVKIKGEVVGGLTIYILHQYFGTRPIAYIYDLGISPPFQKNGLGRALISEVCRFCQEKGFENAYVEAEEEDMDAISFYKKTGFSKEILARQFTYTW